MKENTGGLRHIPFMNGKITGIGCSSLSISDNDRASHKTAKDETTITGYEETEISSAILDLLANTKIKLDICMDSPGRWMGRHTDKIQKRMVRLVKKRVKIRILTRITKDKLWRCKEVATFLELRHLYGITEGSSVDESKSLVITTVVQESKQPSFRVVESTDKSVVEEHQQLFEKLWDKAVPAEQRFRELESDDQQIDSMKLRVALHNGLSVLGESLKNDIVAMLEEEGIMLDRKNTLYSLLEVERILQGMFGPEATELLMQRIRNILNDVF